MADVESTEIFCRSLIRVASILLYLRWLWFFDVLWTCESEAQEIECHREFGKDLDCGCGTDAGLSASCHVKYHELQFGSWDRLGHWAGAWCGIRKLPRGFLKHSFCVHDCLALQMGGQIVPSTVLMRDQIVLSHLQRVSSIFFTWWLEFPACSSTFCLSRLVKQCAVPQCKPAKTCSSDSCCGPFNATYSALNFEQCLTYAHIDAHLQDLLCRMEMTPLALPSWILLTLFSHVVLTVRSCIKLYMWGFLKMGDPQWFTMENPKQKWMIWGCPHDFGKLQM